MLARAARLVEHGAPLVVGDLELPAPRAGAGEVLVEMAFAGVNPVDRYQVLGRVAAEAPLPRTLGSEGAGLVEGRRVWLNRNAVVRPEDGTWATHVLAFADRLIDVPPEVSLESAAAVGVAGVTAWRCAVDLGAVGADDTVLVLGATGGVGSAIVSLARAAGAEVLGQTGSIEKAEWLASLVGESSVVVAATGPALLEALADHPRPTVVFDPLGGDFTGAAIEALGPHGRLVIYGTSADTVGTVPIQQLYRKAITVHGYAGLIEPPEQIADGVRHCFGAIGRGMLTIVIDGALPLGEVNTALDRIASRDLRGKQILALR